MKGPEGAVSRVYLKRKNMSVFYGLYHLACLAHPQFADYKTVDSPTLAASFLHAAKVVDEFFRDNE